MPTLRDEGLVLRTRDLGEADKVVTLLTREHGKLRAAARGSRRARSNLLPVTQPFAYGQYLVFQNRSLHNLSQGQLVRPFRRLREELVAMAYATYLAELADAGLAEEEPHPDAFQCLLAAFDLLEKGDHQPEIVAHWYELNMLGILGYEPELSACVTCRNPVFTADSGDRRAAIPAVMFNIEEGGCVCTSCAHSTGKARRLSPAVYKSLLYLSGATPERLADLRLVAADMASLSNLLTDYIEYRLEKRLHSLEFIRSLQEVK